jgi:hypothetical protein
MIARAVRWFGNDPNLSLPKAPRPSTPRVDLTRAALIIAQLKYGGLVTMHWTF